MTRLQLLQRQQVAKLFSFRLQISNVLRLRAYFQGDALNDRYPEVFQRRRLGRVIGQQADFAHGEVGQDLRGHAVLARIWREAEQLIGLYGVLAFVLERIGFDLIEQSDAAAFLTHVDDDASTFLGHARQGSGELVSAVASQGSQDLTGQTLGVDPRKNWSVGTPGALQQCQVGFAVQIACVGQQCELAVASGQPRAGPAVHETIVPQAIGNEIGNRDQLEPVPPGQPNEIRQLRGRPVTVEDFTEDSSGLEPGEAGQVQSSLGVPGTTEHTSVPRAQREDVSGTKENVGGARP